MTDGASGTIFNIQHFCVHDGPGIRTTVFLKGCPLRCLWCANPESQEAFPQILWEEEKCTLCGSCRAACPAGAITLVGQKLQTDWKKCTGCGSCVRACLQKARSLCGTEITVEAVMQQVLEDRIFYGTDGGLTLSGGEPTMQTAFALRLLQAARAAGITTAMETCGFAPEERLRRLAPFCDTFLYDVKAIDPQNHIRCTGRDNR